MNENKIRTEAAEYDLQTARKHGEMMIGQTLIGNIIIKYSEKVYTLIGELTLEEILENENATPPVLVAGKKNEVIGLLKKVYEVAND